MNITESLRIAPLQSQLHPLETLRANTRVIDAREKVKEVNHGPSVQYQSDAVHKIGN